MKVTVLTISFLLYSVTAQHGFGPCRTSDGGSGSAVCLMTDGRVIPRDVECLSPGMELQFCRDGCAAIDNCRTIEFDDSRGRCELHMEEMVAGDCALCAMKADDYEPLYHGPCRTADGYGSYYCVGNDLIPYGPPQDSNDELKCVQPSEDVTQDDCQRMCDQMDECLGIEYRPLQCELHLEPVHGNCAVCMGNGSPAGNCNYESGRWRGGRVVNRINPVPSLYDCCTECLLDEDCSHWQWKSGFCVLKSSGDHKTGGSAGWVRGMI